MPTAPVQTDSHPHRYIEYVDIFSKPEVVPSAGMKDNLLLFDTFDGTDPLSFLFDSAEHKMYQKVSIYVTQGEFVCAINGSEKTVPAGSVMTIMPENLVEAKTASPDFSYFMMVVYPKLSSQVYTDLGMTYCSARLSLCHFISPLSNETMQRMLDIYNEMKHDILSADYENKLGYLRCLLNALVVENINVHRYAPIPLQGNSNSRQYDVYRRFLGILNKYSTEHRSVRYYADQLGISSKYLSFVCLSYSQRNASKWIDDSVIQKAKAMLVVHHYSLSETSNILHFPTPSSFSRFFKRVTGMTPKEFVQQQKEHTEK